MTRHLTQSVRVLFLAVVALTWTFAPQARADADIYQKTIKSTCWIVVAMENGKLAYGTGWVADKERRQVLTNDHVVLGKKDATIYFPILKQGKVETQSRS